MKRRVLLTGATGLLGAELLPVLGRAGFEVIPVSRSPAALPGHRRCDLAEPGQAASLLSAVRPDAVVHLAGQARGPSDAIYRANVLATVPLLRAAGRLDSRPYCVLFGSAAEYGASAAPLRETDPLRPLGDYGRAKAAQTILASGIARQLGIPLTILRPFNVVSPRLPESTALGNMRSQLRRGRGGTRRVRCGRLDLVRDFVPASAVAETVRRLLAEPAPGRTFNVCTGIGIELRAIVEAMARRLEVAIEILVDPALAALPAPRTAVGDPSALRAALDLSFESTPESVAEVVLSES